MAVIDVRGEAERTARLLSSLGQGIARIVNPNFELQERIKQATLASPELGAALGQLPPEALEGLGIGRLQPFLAQFPQTSAQLSEERLRDLLANLDPETAEAFDQFLLARQAGTTPTGLVVEPRRATAARGIELTPEERARLGEEVVTGRPESERLLDELKSQTLRSAQGLLGLYEEGAELTPEQKGILRVTVGRDLFADEDMQKQHKLNLELANARDAATFKRFLSRQALEDAQWMFRQTNGVGSVELWQEWLENPGARGEPRFRELNEATVALDVRDKLPRASSISTRIGVLAGQIARAADEGNDEAIPPALDLINMQLRMFDALDLPNVDIPEGLRPVYDVPEEEAGFDIRAILPGGRPLFGGKRRLYFVDNEGNIYTPEAVQAMTSGQQALLQRTETTDTGFDVAGFEQQVRQALSGIPEENRGAAMQAIIDANSENPNLGQIRAIANRVARELSR